MAFNDSVDSDLVKGLKSRDPEALAAAYDKYAGSAYALFLRIVHDQGVAEDLLQELFLRIWHRSADFDPARGTLGVWIVSIARNMGIDYLRSARARFDARARPLQDVSELPVTGSGAQSELSLTNSRAVSAALAELKPNEKRVLELAYFEGCSQSEIALRMAQPLGTVKSWMRTALGRLRAATKTRAIQ
jgi:RNA polymerase sigma-70 factor, ECF subfamily